MADPDAKVSYTDIHPKTAAAAFAALASAVIIPICKQKLGLDLSGQEANFEMLVVVAAAYLMPGA